MRRPLLLACLLAGLLVPTVARADDAAVAEAKQRFDEGIKLVDAGRHEEARLKFQQAAAVLKAPAVLFNLARAEQLTGHEYEAVAHFKAFLRVSENDPKITDAERAKARENIAALAPKVGQIDVAAPPGARIAIDGNALDEPATEPIAVPPGRHVVEATFEGRVKSVTVDCPMGLVTRATIEFEAAPAQPPPSSGVGPTEPPPVSPSHHDPTRWIVGGAIGGAGVIALGLGIGFGASSQGSKSDAEDLRRSYPGLCAKPELPQCAQYDAKRSSAESAATVSVVSYVAGGVLVAGAVATVLLWPHAKETSTGTTARALTPWMSKDGAGAALSGSF
jgi:hypothetical protein